MVSQLQPAVDVDQGGPETVSKGAAILVHRRLDATPQDIPGEDDEAAEAALRRFVVPVATVARSIRALFPTLAPLLERGFPLTR